MLTSAVKINLKIITVTPLLVVDREIRRRAAALAAAVGRIGFPSPRRVERHRRCRLRWPEASGRPSGLRRLLVKQSRRSGVDSRRRRRWRRRRSAQKDALAERKPRAGAERPGSTETAVAAVDS